MNGQARREQGLRLIPRHAFELYAFALQKRLARTTGLSFAKTGGVAQLGEHLLCKQGVIGSIPFTSTSYTPEDPMQLREDKSLAFGPLDEAPDGRTSS